MANVVVTLRIMPANPSIDLSMTEAEAKKEIVSLVVLSTEKLLESNPDEKFDDKAINQMKKI